LNPQPLPPLDERATSTGDDASFSANEAGAINQQEPPKDASAGASDSAPPPGDSDGGLDGGSDADADTDADAG
jgi:hypothetical protein